MRDVHELQEQLAQLGRTIAEAKEAARKLARERLIDPGAVPRQRRREVALDREF